MTYNLSYDYCAILTLLVLVFFYYVTPKYKNFQNRLFGWILVANFASCIMDALSAGILLAKYPDEIILNRLVLSLYQLFQHALPPLYFLYMIIVVYQDRAKEKLKHYWPGFIPGIAIAFINICSVGTQWAFRYDSSGYHRTNFYYFSWGTLALYMVLCLILVFKNEAKAGFLPKLAVMFYSIASILSAYIQLKHPSELVISFAASLTIFTMHMSLQNPSLLKAALEDAEKARKVAEEANEAKKNFLANMSHEIRTPMNAICGMTYLLESFELKTDARDYVNTIQHASENLMVLINEILDFSKVDSGQITLNETEYHVRNLIREVGGMILEQVPDNITISMYLDPAVPKVMRGDVTKIKQIVMNLCSNAIKFTERGEVKLRISSVEKEDGKAEIKIAVSDTGIGIKDEDVQRIFARFEQVDMAKNRRREGTGLGLALVKGFCELMNGSVEVESTPGVGSIFTATIEQTVVEKYTQSELDKLNRYVYVVLEQNPFVRRSIEETLKSIGASYTVEEVYSTDAFEKFPGMNYCLVYDEERYGKEIEAVDVSQIKGLFKLSLVNFDAKIPEDCKDVHYSRKPFNMLTLIDSVGVLEVNKPTEEEETVYFSDKVQVAIVDDNKVNLKVTAAILKKFGLTAKTFLSGYEMLDEFDIGSRYDLIFMDHMMPDMDGVETVKRIRALHKGNSSNVPIVALTANAVKGVEKEYFDAGMNDALFKPVNVDNLKDVLVKWLPASMRSEKKSE